MSFHFADLFVVVCFFSLNFIIIFFLFADGFILIIYTCIYVFENDILLNHLGPIWWMLEDCNSVASIVKRSRSRSRSRSENEKEREIQCGKTMWMVWIDLKIYTHKTKALGMARKRRCHNSPIVHNRMLSSIYINYIAMISSSILHLQSE